MKIEVNGTLINGNRSPNTLEIKLELQEAGDGLDFCGANRGQQYRLVGIEVTGKVPPELQAVLDALAAS